MIPLQCHYIKRLLLALVILILGQFVSTRSATAKTYSNQSRVIEQIENDFSAGEITYEQKALLQVQAIRNPSNLPQMYRSILSGPPTGNHREATLILRDIRMNWDLLSTGAQLSISDALTRHPAAFTFDSPGGFFKLHYDVTGTNAVSPADTNGNSTPDYVERMAAYCDSSWQKHLALGFLEPPSDNGLGGDDKYDVYFENMGLYGYAITEASGSRPWNDFYSHLVLNNDFIGFPANDDPEGDVLGAAKVTIAHEYHHAVQFGYDAGEAGWFMELDATYVEDIVFDQTNDNYNYLSIFTDAPAKSLMENSFHMYSSFIWGLYLTQNFDTSLMRAVWEGARYGDVFSSLSDTLFERYGWTQDSALADFVTWNFATSSRNDNIHHDEAAQYPLINVGASYNNYPVSLRNSPDSPAGYGSNYIQFFPGSSNGTLKLTFDGADTREWAAYVIISTAINAHQYQKLILNPGSFTNTFYINDFEALYSVTLVGVNTAEFSSGAFFSYSAAVVIPHAVSTSLLTTGTVIYSGSTRAYQFQVSNPSEFNDVYRIMYWDDLGWIVSDTISRAIAAFSDTAFTISVHPPQGTPLSTTAQLHFRAVSVNDTLVSEELVHAVQTALYRGDVNFSGSISILDLTYLIDFFFRSGPAPVPVREAGDWNCDGATNIIDLTKIVDRLFRGGSLPPCNPY